MEENMPLMTQLNQDQLQKGEAPDGGKIGQYAFMKYAKAKNKINPLPGLGNVDLILTNAFRSAFHSFLSGISVFIESTDKKMDELIYKYSAEKIFGLAPDSRKSFFEPLYNSFYLKICNVLKK
jgi:hypothetical protein